MNGDHRLGTFIARWCFEIHPEIYGREVAGKTKYYIVFTARRSVVAQDYIIFMLILHAFALILLCLSFSYC